MYSPQPTFLRHLEFSTTTGPAEQQLLFDQTALIRPGHVAGDPLPATFFTEGYAVLKGVRSFAEALATLESGIAGLDERCHPLLAHFAGRTQLAKVDRIPVCHDIVPRSFQALHFDMGQPIISDSTQTMYLVLGLYCPPETGDTSAVTRVVSLRRLLVQRDWGTKDTVERDLIAYAEAFGDGWTSPAPVNTHRLACFARVLDAVTRRHELTHYTDKTTGDWFQDDRRQDGTVGLRNEVAYYAGCGLRLEEVEERICLRGGDLLVVDNLRAVHGRFGRRRPAEIYQFLFGVRSATPLDIDRFRASLVAEFVPTTASPIGQPPALRNRAA